MATNNESVFLDCENEFFETALDDYFTQLTVNGDDDEYEELSRITNSVLTPSSASSQQSSEEPGGSTDYDQLLMLPPDCAKEYFQSSTPKRERHEFLRPQPKPKLLVRFAEFKQPSEESESDDVNGGSCEASSSSSVSVEAEEPDIPSLSVIIRQHRNRQLILSPFSQNLKDAILRQDSMRKRQQRLAISKKAQRASLRV